MKKKKSCATEGCRRVVQHTVSVHAILCVARKKPSKGDSYDRLNAVVAKKEPHTTESTTLTHELVNCAVLPLVKPCW